jgi:CspA family cold shock protein
MVWGDGDLETGTVKWFNDSKGYGFIDGGDGREFFVHHSQIESEGFRSLKEGELVSFEADQGPKGPCAKQVKKL